MTARRRPVIVALIASVLLLLGSMTAVAVYTGGHTTRSQAPTGQTSGWQGWTSPGTGAPTSGQPGVSGWDDMGMMMGDGQRGWMNADGWTVSGGTGTAVTADQALSLAQGWVDTNAPGATVDPASTMSGAYRFTVTRNGQAIALVWVDATTGRLGARTIATPTPARS